VEIGNMKIENVEFSITE